MFDRPAAILSQMCNAELWGFMVVSYIQSRPISLQHWRFKTTWAKSPNPERGLFSSRTRPLNLHIFSVLILGGISGQGANKLMHYSPDLCFAKPWKQKDTNRIKSSLWVRRKKGKHTRIEFLCFPATAVPHSARVSLSLCLSLSFPLTFVCFCFPFSPVLSLCGILAAILALGSHLSFGGTMHSC